MRQKRDIKHIITLEQKPFSNYKALGKIHKGVKIKVSNNMEILVKSDYMFEGYLENHINFKKFSSVIGSNEASGFRINAYLVTTFFKPKLLPFA